MLIISKPEEISKIICTSIKQYKNISFAVAWASFNDTSKYIFNNINKIKLYNCTVGLHFYQTHPDFIEPFVDNGPIKFIKKNKGIFHPKIYLFWNNSLEWTCLIGSANFTKSALSVNDETMVLVNSKDIQEFTSIKETIDNYHKSAEFISLEKFVKYKKFWKNKNKAKEDLDDFEEISNLGLSQLMSLPWSEYYNKLFKTRLFKERLQLLNNAHKLFLSNNFQSFDELTRKNIGGVVKIGNNINDWYLFGRMPVPYFAKRLSDNDIHKSYKDISKQLEIIPLDGEVTKNHYEKFLKYFINHDGWGYSISTISRLLTMKRPDQFFCITQANEKGLLESLNIEESIQRDKKEQMYERYWNEVVEPIRKALWFKSEKPLISKEEKLAWNFRTAMLDALLYLEKE